MKKSETVEEIEKRDAAGYALIRSQAEESEEWEPEQVWTEDEQLEQEEPIQETETTPGRTTAMDEALEHAAEIRRKNQKKGRVAKRRRKQDTLAHAKR